MLHVNCSGKHPPPLQKHCNTASTMCCPAAKDFRGSWWHHDAIPPLSRNHEPWKKKKGKHFALKQNWKRQLQKDFRAIKCFKKEQAGHDGHMTFFWWQVLKPTYIDLVHTHIYSDEMPLILPPHSSSLQRGVPRVCNNCVSCFQESTSGHSLGLFMRRMGFGEREERENMRRRTNS